MDGYLIQPIFRKPKTYMVLREYKQQKAREQRVIQLKKTVHKHYLENTLMSKKSMKIMQARKEKEAE